MKELKIKLDVFNGLVWKEYYDIDTDTSCTRIDIVDNDENLEFWMTKRNDYWCLFII